MLGKITTVCVLVLVSACLVRQQPDSEAKVTRVVDDVTSLFSKWGAKSTDDMVAKFWAKTDKSDADFEDLHKLLTSSNAEEAIIAFKKPVNDVLAKLDKSYVEYYKLPAGAPKRISDLALTSLENNAKELDKLSKDYEQNFNLLRIAGAKRSPRGDAGSIQYRLQIEYPANKAWKFGPLRPSGITKGFRLVENAFGNRIFKFVGDTNEVVKMNLLFGNYYNLCKFIRGLQNDSITLKNIPYLQELYRPTPNSGFSGLLPDRLRLAGKRGLYREFMRRDFGNKVRSSFENIRSNIAEIRVTASPNVKSGYFTPAFMSMGGIPREFLSDAEGILMVLKHTNLFITMLDSSIRRQIALLKQFNLNTAKQAELQADALQGFSGGPVGYSPLLNKEVEKIYDGKLLDEGRRYFSKNTDIDMGINAWVDDTKEFLRDSFAKHDSSITSAARVNGAMKDVLFALDELKKVSM